MIFISSKPLLYSHASLFLFSVSKAIIKSPCPNYHFLFSRIRILQKHLGVQYNIANAYVGIFLPLPLATKYFDLQHVILFLRRENVDGRVATKDTEANLLYDIKYNAN